MASMVARGRAKGIVVRTGNSSEIGKISQAITSTPNVKTSMEKNLSFLAKFLVAAAVFCCVLIIVISILYKNDPKDSALLGITLAVSVIPESLVAVLTVAMSLGVSRMAKQNAIVRKLPAVESLGSVTVICSDKTGTLTEGKMGAAELWSADGTFYSFTESTKLDPELGCINRVRRVPKSPDELTPLPKSPKDTNLHLLSCMMVSSLCNNSTISKDPETKEWKPTGDPTEIAMEIAGRKTGISRSWFQDTVGFHKIGEYPFDSDRKMMSVIYQQSNAHTGPSSFPAGFTLILAKGAPEGILKACTGIFPRSLPGTYLDLPNYTPEPLTDEIVEEISKKSSEMASRGLRVLAFAVRKVHAEEASGILQSRKDTKSECELNFVGLIGLIDPPK